VNNPINLDFQKKTPGLAAVLAFFIPGLGHIYCGQIGKGVIFLLSFILGSFLLVLPGVIVWIYSMVSAYNLAQEINDKNDLIIAKYNEQNKIEEEIISKQKQEEENKTLYIDIFKQSLLKNSKLYKNELINLKEFNDRKNNLINELSFKQINVSQEDFLFELIPLKENLILDSDDMLKIKSYILN
jgi:TM2 domain-containing membrane protein YozV